MSVDPVVSELERHDGVTRVRRALADAGAEGQVAVLTRPPHGAVDLAAMLGVDPSQVVVPLLLAAPAPEADEEPRLVLVLAAASHAVDLDKVAGVLGVEGLARALPAVARGGTGFDPEGFPPVGHLVPLETFVDVSLAACPVVWAGAGHACAVFPTRYEELLRITTGHSVEVA